MYRDYLDGRWLTELHARGTQVTVGVREAVLILEAMIDLSRLPGQTWEAADSPRHHAASRPQGAILSLGAMKAE